ncbi:MAG TPA: hypothetical protein VE842_04815, partial [Pyrinomonadaceae bacterium]|nr:hypothetical protein [Pyrinomonadaceae bacterium]
MNSVLAFLALAVGVTIAVLVPNEGQPALIFCIVLAAIASVTIYSVGQERKFLLQIFIMGLLLRVLVGGLIFRFELQNFFGGDAYTYDAYGFLMMRSWR